MPIPEDFVLNIGQRVLIDPTLWPSYGTQGVILVPVMNVGGGVKIARVKTDKTTTDFYWTQLSLDESAMWMEEQVQKYPQGIGALRVYGRKVQL